MRNRETHPDFPFHDMHQVERANRDAGQHFFAPDALRFFNSRILDTLHGHRYFVTSERNDMPYSDPSPRRYTIRHALPNGTVETVGDFGAYYHAHQAHRVARELCKNDRRGELSVVRDGVRWEMLAREIDGYVVVSAIPRLDRDIVREDGARASISRIPAPSDAQYRRAAATVLDDGQTLRMIDRGSKYGHPRIYRVTTVG